ncbi:hypothetical protein, partial [Flavobacterium aquaticum]|uniref:hypothetical protein n=1 Tax=Flavobacterium aquaticum TaxID=1236486 RepID=UPI001C658728
KFRVVDIFFTPSYTEFFLKWIALKELHRAFYFIASGFGLWTKLRLVGCLGISTSLDMTNEQTLDMTK